MMLCLDSDVFHQTAVALEAGAMAVEAEEPVVEAVGQKAVVVEGDVQANKEVREEEAVVEAEAGACRAGARS